MHDHNIYASISQRETPPNTDPRILPIRTVYCLIRQDRENMGPVFVGVSHCVYDFMNFRFKNTVTFHPNEKNLIPKMALHCIVFGSVTKRLRISQIS